MLCKLLSLRYSDPTNFPFIAGELQVLPVKNHASLCIGDSVSLEVEITGAQGQPNVQWSHGQSLLDDSEHYSSNSVGTVLDISNALPLHAGTYYAMVTDGVSSEHAIFNVEVHGNKNNFLSSLKGFKKFCYAVTPTKYAHFFFFVFRSFASLIEFNKN